MLDDKEFQRKFAAALEGFRKGAVKGVRLATSFVKLEAQKLTPVDEGNLKASAYTFVSVSNQGCVGEVGFTAHYAVYVHEYPMKLKGLPRKGEGAKGLYWDPQGTASNKFLMKAVYNNPKKIKEIMQAAIQL